MSDTILSVSGLRTEFPVGKQATIKAVNGVSFSIKEGEILGIIGETGSGKSITALSVLRLVPRPGKIVGGEIIFKGENLMEKSNEQMRQVRGKEISMIFQDPGSSLNPLFTIGDQVREAIQVHKKLSKERAAQETVTILGLTGLPDAAEIAKKYPHELSGGMKQRVMIAMAISCRPSLLIADEPTTALDTTIQAQVLRLIKKINHELNVSILLISHNFGVISEMCNRVAVMYAGTIVELADVFTIFEKPVHPYTIGLIKSVPKIDRAEGKFETIPGSIPDPLNLPIGCNFNPRCAYAKEDCLREKPDLIEIEKGHYVSCFHWRDVVK